MYILILQKHYDKLSKRLLVTPLPLLNSVSNQKFESFSVFKYAKYHILDLIGCITTKSDVLGAPFMHTF